MTHSTVTADSSVIFGLDLGDRYTHVCGLDGLTGEIFEEGRIPTTPNGVARRFTDLPPAVIAIEAGTHSRWVSYQLQCLGHDVLVAHPRKVRLITDNDTKNDKLDAQRLALLARADPRLLHPIQHRSPEAQADLALIRARDQLVQTRTKLVNHVRCAVKGFGCRIPKSIGAKVLHRKAAPYIPSVLRPALEPMLEQLAALEEGIKRYDKLIKERANDAYPETELLRQVPGVGPLTALAFVLTLEDPYRFPNREAVASYLGLRPRQRASGKDPQLRITKAGNGYLRRLMVGSAQYVLGPFGPDTDLKRWGLKLANRGGRGAKKKAIVAVARKLGVLLHKLWLTGDEYEPLHNMRRRGTKEAAPAEVAQ